MAMGFSSFSFAFVFTLQISIGLSESDFELVVSAGGGGGRSDENGLVVRKIGDNLTLTCELRVRDDSRLEDVDLELAWFFPFADSNRSRTIQSKKNSSELFLDFLQPTDAGKYTCGESATPVEVTHVYLAVRPHNPVGVPYCSASMFSCGEIPSDRTGAKCIPMIFLCDGRPDCPFPSKDEDPEVCGTNDPCIDKLQCRDGRCIPKKMCCNGRWDCLSHPCCEEQVHDDVPTEKLGGGLRNDKNEPLILQVTLYKACVCLFVIFTFFIILTSVICRARLKRISNRHMETQSPESLNCNTTHPITTQDCQYSLVLDSNCEVSARLPPSYSDLVAENNESSSSHLPNSQSSDTVQNHTEDGTTGDDSPARRPNDFGVGFIANAIFNSRYRPVPTQQNLETNSFDYVTDSDSSCRSPHLNTNNTLEFNSHFYGERIGGASPDNRRTRQSNALDRILDRFGLNAPYNVDIDRTWECQTFLSPPEYDQNARRPFIPYLYSFWSRLKDIFGRNHQERSSTSAENASEPVDITVNRHRRRPDTPDVPEPTFDGFSQMRYFQQRGCFSANRSRFPPPYTQYAPDPPPPYVSRENLSNNNADQNGNVVVAEVSPTLDNVNNNNNNDAETVTTIGEQIHPVDDMPCDDNGNVETKDEDQKSEVLLQIVNASDLSNGNSLRRESTTSDSNQSNNSVLPGINSNLDSSILIESTEECGLIFPPTNLEFIDSDSVVDHSVVDA